jgi:DNA-binding response OmpR family regulator
MPKEKVLVVDDDSAIRFTLTEALRAWGYDPLEASTVTSASVSFKED